MTPVASPPSATFAVRGSRSVANFISIVRKVEM